MISEKAGILSLANGTFADAWSIKRMFNKRLFQTRILEDVLTTGSSDLHVFAIVSTDFTYIRGRILAAKPNGRLRLKQLLLINPGNYLFILVLIDFSIFLKIKICLFRKSISSTRST